MYFEWGKGKYSFLNIILGNIFSIVNSFSCVCVLGQFQATFIISILKQDLTVCTLFI